jgi:hypothetical protein
MADVPLWDEDRPTDDADEMEWPAWYRRHTDAPGFWVAKVQGPLAVGDPTARSLNSANATIA